MVSQKNGAPIQMPWLWCHCCSVAQLPGKRPTDFTLRSVGISSKICRKQLESYININHSWTAMTSHCKLTYSSNTESNTHTQTCTSEALQNTSSKYTHVWHIYNTWNTWLVSAYKHNTLPATKRILVRQVRTVVHAFRGISIHVT